MVSTNKLLKVAGKGFNSKALPLKINEDNSLKVSTNNPKYLQGFTEPAPKNYIGVVGVFGSEILHYEKQTLENNSGNIGDGYTSAGSGVIVIAGSADIKIYDENLDLMHQVFFDFKNISIESVFVHPWAGLVLVRSGKWIACVDVNTGLPISNSNYKDGPSEAFKDLSETVGDRLKYGTYSDSLYKEKYFGVEQGFIINISGGQLHLSFEGDITHYLDYEDISTLSFADDDVRTAFSSANNVGFKSGDDRGSVIIDGVMYLKLKFRNFLKIDIETGVIIFYESGVFTSSTMFSVELDGKYFFIGHDNDLMEYDPSTFAILNRYSLGLGTSSMVAHTVQNDCLVFNLMGTNKIYAVDSVGKIKWKVTLPTKKPIESDYVACHSLSSDVFGRIIMSVEEDALIISGAPVPIGYIANGGL